MLLLRALFPAVRGNTIREWVHALTHRSYGGVGYGFGRREVLDMTIDEIQWYVGRGAKADRQMAEAIRAAQRSATKKPSGA